ncbi:rod shape-determining protein [Streptomyces macrosporus]|uniref:Rod shape-determining protein n=1 Tax=Streptomyces macrosporus TaxID=44032 RepID=A0ABP5WJN5_9ACTN
MTVDRPRPSPPGGHGAPSARHLRSGIALDLGSARTRAWVPGWGLLLDAPTRTSSDPDASRPLRQGAIVDPEGTARMLEHLLGRHLPRSEGLPFALTTPVLGGIPYREAALAALRVLRPRTVVTVPTAKAIALGAHADLSHPLVIVDVGAQVTEVFLLVDGAVADAHRAALGTDDLDGAATHHELAEAVAAMVADTVGPDRTPQATDALQHGVLLAGGGALRPEVPRRLAKRLSVPIQPIPAPHTAAVRGAAQFLQAAHGRPPATGVAALPRQR